MITPRLQLQLLLTCLTTFVHDAFCGHIREGGLFWLLLIIETDTALNFWCSRQQTRRWRLVVISASYVAELNTTQHLSQCLSEPLVLSHDWLLHTGPKCPRQHKHLWSAVLVKIYAHNSVAALYPCKVFDQLPTCSIDFSLTVEIWLWGRKQTLTILCGPIQLWRLVYMCCL